MPSLVISEPIKQLRQVYTVRVISDSDSKEYMFSTEKEAYTFISTLMTKIDKYNNQQSSKTETEKWQN